MAKQSILEYLREKRIFSVTHDKDVFKFLEQCDEYYFAILTKNQTMQLIAELQELVDRPKEPRTVKLDYMSGAVLQSWHGFADQGEVVSPDGSSIHLLIPDSTYPGSNHRSILVGPRGGDGHALQLSGYTQLEQRGIVQASSFSFKIDHPPFMHRIGPNDWHANQPYAMQKAWIRDETNRRAYTLEVSFGPEWKRNFFNLTETQY